VGAHCGVLAFSSAGFVTDSERGLGIGATHGWTVPHYSRGARVLLFILSAISTVTQRSYIFFINWPRRPSSCCIVRLYGAPGLSVLVDKVGMLVQVMAPRILPFLSTAVGSVPTVSCRERLMKPGIVMA